MDPALSTIVAYGLGSISFAVLVARARGVDIRAHGSGNPGATNVGRVLGPGWGRLVLALDVAKGLVPVLLLSGVRLDDPTGKASIAAAAVLGHVFPITSGFRGGKGVATLLGAQLALDPLLGLGSALIHVAVKKTTGFVALASCALAWAFPALQQLARLAGITEGRYLDGGLVLGGLAAVVTLRHAGNFRRIREGTEDRYDESLPSEPAEPRS